MDLFPAKEFVPASSRSGGGRSDHAPPVSLNSLVTLNVGGTKFVTTRQTLLRVSDSMLAKMFDPESPLQPGET